MKLDCNQAVLLIIDVQQKLLPVMDGYNELITSMTRLVKGIQTLEIPIIITEQYPKGIGPTVSTIRELILDIEPVEKRSFSCCFNENFMSILAKYNRKQALISGIETHVCVYQTCVDLLESGYDVYLIEDALSSRKQSDKDLAIRVLEKEGVNRRSVEMALFELVKTSEHDRFKDISTIIK
ncbi:MAG: hydrolase [Candidatus Marinimicrobia bacterium]|nr:hydrolase [Candidatus Neomarinimicrobiota bacterium]